MKILLGIYAFYVAAAVGSILVRKLNPALLVAAIISGLTIGLSFRAVDRGDDGSIWFPTSALLLLTCSVVLEDRLRAKAHRPQAQSSEARRVRAG